MKYNFLILLLVLLGGLTACSKEDDNGGTVDPPQEGVVYVKIVNPKSAPMDSEMATRVTYVNMAENSTIRLYIYKKNEAYVYPHPDDFVTEQAFRVNADQSSVTMCRVDDDGNLIPGSDITDTDLALPRGEYEFYMISPAVKLTRQTKGGLLYTVMGYSFDHGGKSMMVSPMQAFDIDYDSTPIGDGTNGLFTYNPLPFQRMTSRITFTIKKGTQVNDLQIDDRGIEINNIIEKAYGRPNFFLGDTELTPLGTNNTGNVGIKDFAFDQSGDGGRGTYYGYAELIPTSEMFNVEIRFHVRVEGGNYKTAVVPLNNQEFIRGKSYNYSVTVNADGILVAGWDSVGWETIIGN